MAFRSFGRLAKRYAIVIIFPTFTVATIYADWSHTQAWKEQQKQLHQHSQQLLAE